MSSQIKTTTVGSYPVPAWMVGDGSQIKLRDAVMAVLKTQELAGLDLLTDGELPRFDPSHPDANGMVDYFVSRMGGIRKEFSISDIFNRPLSVQPKGICDWGRRFQRKNWKRTWCGISGGGRRTPAGSAF